MNKTLDLVLKEFEQAKKFRAGKEGKWDAFYKQYRSYLEGSKFPWRNDYFIPYSFWTIETIVPRLVGLRPKLMVMAREPQDESQTRIWEQLIDYQWSEMDMDVKLENLVREGLKYGTSFMRVGWDKKNQMPEIDNVDILDLYIDPEATKIADARYLCFRTFKELEDLKDNPNYKNLSQLEESKENIKDDVKAKRYASQSMSTPSTYRSEESNKIEIIEYWTKKRLIVVANQRVVICDKENPYEDGKIPFVDFRDYPVAFEFYGIGEIEHLDNLQDIGNSLRNQILDGNEYITSPMYEQDPIANINQKNIAAKPGLILPKGLKPFQHGNIPSAAFGLSDRIANEIQMTTGVTDYQMGGTTYGSNLTETATGIQRIQEEGNRRFSLKIKHLESTIRDLGRMIIARNQQFVTKQQVIRIIGENGAEFPVITPDDIKGSYDIISEAGSTMPVNKDVQKQQTLELVASLAQLQQIAVTQGPQGPMPALDINWFELAKRLSESLGIKNPDQIIRQAAPPPPPPEVVSGPGQSSEINNMLNTMEPGEIEQYLNSLPPEDARILSDEILQNLPTQEANQGIRKVQQEQELQQMMGGQ